MTPAMTMRRMNSAVHKRGEGCLTRCGVDADYDYANHFTRQTDLRRSKDWKGVTCKRCLVMKKRR